MARLDGLSNELLNHFSSIESANAKKPLPKNFFGNIWDSFAGQQCSFCKQRRSQLNTHEGLNYCSHCRERHTCNQCRQFPRYIHRIANFEACKSCLSRILCGILKDYTDQRFAGMIAHIEHLVFRLKSFD